MSNALIGQITIVAVVIIFLSSVAFSLYLKQKQERQRRIMDVITGGNTAGLSPDGKEKHLAKQRADIARKLKAAEASEKKDKDKTTLREMIQQAGLDTSISRFWISSVLFAAVVSVITTAFNVSTLTQALIICAAFFGMPRWFLKFRARRRQKKFLEEFADALEAMVRLLQAGMPVSEAIAMVSREFSGPLGEEMMYIYEDQKIGVPMGEAAERAAKRMPLTEMQMFATAVQIQSETGSSLSEVLSNLATVIRARFRLKRKVKALSSEAKASAGIIGCLPLLVAGGLYLVNPDYISLLFVTKKGQTMITCACIWMSFGVMMMKQMINFKI